MAVNDFPLFPLDLVLLPSELVPLHIFEPCYRQMISHCVENDREFGVIWLADGGLKDVGCGAQITEVSEAYDDGRFDILAEGTNPFRLLERHEDRDYPCGAIEYLDDRDAAISQKLAGQVREAYAELAERSTGDEPDSDQLATWNAFEMAATVDIGLAAKQSLLEVRSEQARLQLLVRLFKAAMERLDFVEKVEARAQTNGKVRYEE